MKKTISVLLIAACLLVLTACFYYSYGGEYKELYTVAVYSIPDSAGYMYHGEGAFDPDIYIWEQDNYGRTIFSYCEDYSNYCFALIVSQTCDEANVYFYPDVNYVLTYIESESLYPFRDDYLKNRTQGFYLENKDKLKEENDWNKPLDKTKCVSYPITDQKIIDEDVFVFDARQCDKILSDYTETLNLLNPERAPHRTNRVLQVDAEGRVLHEIYGIHRYYDNPDHKSSDDYTAYYIVLWVITDKDGNYDKEKGIMVIYSYGNNEDITHSPYTAKEVMEFKSRNGWKYAFCSN